MSDPFVGELKLVPYTFAPKGWAFCSGQLLPIAQNQALFALLGVRYGGDGVTTFQLPDLRGRVPVGYGQAYPIGAAGGEAVHTLTPSEMPMHTHQGRVAAAASQVAPGTGVVLAQPGKAAFATAATTTMSPAATATAGLGQPHENMAPSLVLTYVIALAGVFPSRG